MSNAKIPITWTTEQLKFIKDNYYSMTFKELLSAVEKMNVAATYQGLRHQCKRMKLAKQVQIRWSKEDTQYLIENYKLKGDLELSMELNLFKRTYRVIDGKKVFRKFNKKHVEKKRELLNIYRTDAEIFAIRQRNIRIGLSTAYTKDNNAYTLGHKPPIADEGTIKTWKHGDYLFKYIKINGDYIHYHRYLWEQEYGEIPKGHNVVFKDGDAMNCILENLECISNQELQLRNSGSIWLSEKFVVFCMLGHNSTNEDRVHMIDNHPELIELKRNQMILDREIRKL